MRTSTEPDPESLARTIARSRRIYDRVWIAFTLVFVLAGAIVWLFTRNIEHLLGGLFYGAFPLIGLVYNHFFLFNPWRDPAATKEHLENVAAKQQKNACTVGYVNGTIIILFSPIFFFLGIATGDAEHGILGAILGGLAGVASFVFGLSMVLWARRRKVKDSGHG